MSEGYSVIERLITKKTTLTSLALWVLSLGGCTLPPMSPPSIEVTQKIAAPEYRATGDLGVVIERANGEIQIINAAERRVLAAVGGLGDLSHASVVYSKDEKYAYVFGRDGGLTQINMLTQAIENRVVQSGNSIGGAISQDGRFVAVSNYTPGGVKIFNAQSLELVADISATALGGAANVNSTGDRTHSKVVGLVDAPGNRFVFSLFDTDEIWIAEQSKGQWILNKFKGVGSKPYDALLTPDGRYYIAGLFGEDGMALLDLWQPELGTRKILPKYGKGEARLPVYKMPHLEGWAVAGDYAYVPAVGQHEVIVISKSSWQEVKRIPVHGQPVFVMARPGGRHVWVNFALPNNDTVQIIDTLKDEIVQTLKPGKAVLHMEFMPRGEAVWLSVRDENQVQIYDTENFQLLKTLRSKSPSGIFFTARAHKLGL